MEIVIILFVLVAGSIALSAWIKNKSPDGSSKSDENSDGHDNGGTLRKCLSCGFEGEMKTWISNYKAPKFIVIAGFILGYIPGLIFLAVYWGKYKCPACGAIGKNE